jgi:hypothetical protein
MKRKINQLATYSKEKNIRGPYKGINEFKKGYHPRNNLVKMTAVSCLQIPITFSVRIRMSSISFRMYIGLVVLGRRKYIQLSIST